MKNRIWLKRTSIGLILVLMLLFLSFMLIRNNIHAVVSGEVYRSAQLSPSRLRRLVQDKHIHTIINLRGANPNYRWYQDEMRVSRVMGVTHYDIRLNSTQKPKPSQLRRLVFLLEHAQKPILLHCQGGADRTGLASALFLLLKGRSIVDAKQQYSWFYHVKSPRSIGKLVIPYYTTWLKKHRFKSSNKKRFLNWVNSPTLLRSL